MQVQARLVILIDILLRKLTQPLRLRAYISSNTAKQQVSCYKNEGLLTFQRNYFRGWIHDGTFSRNWTSNGCCWVAHVNYHYLRLLSHFLPDADEFVRFHCQGAESNVCWVNAQILELKRGNSVLYYSSLEDVSNLSLYILQYSHSI